MLWLHKHPLPLLLILLLTACGGSDSQVVETPLPPPAEQPVVNYNGPAASTEDIQNFKTALWDNIATKDRCGACHVQGEQEPTFARNDDINLAYAAVTSLVNLGNPSESRLVTKVGGGHNCWLASDSACADILTTWIGQWAERANINSQATQIQLLAPPVKEPGANKNFPADPQLFADNLYPLLTQFCASCHTNSAAIPISPYFASSNVSEAYEAAKPRINLDNPADSRLVGRLRDEFHNCWSNCPSDATALQNAIQRMADGIDLTQLDPELVNSKALTLFEGTLASGGGRFDANVIGKWEFKTGSGNIAYDTSGVDPALDLTLSGQYEWVGGYGIQLGAGKAQGATSASKKLHDLIRATGEFAIEAWVAPANVTQEGPARIVSYSGGRDRRNFTLGQTLYNYDALLRHSNTDGNGAPALSTADADEDLQAALQHVVFNYDPVNGRRLYVNGRFTDDMDPTEPGTLNDWDSSFALVLGNEASNDRPWAGTIRMVAIHNKTLSEAEIQGNFDAGVGQQYYLLFGLSHLIDVPQAYLVFEVSQFDSYSYLFAEPFFISLDSSAQIPTVPIKGIRIGVNGRESSAGQVFANLDTQLSATSYDAQTGQPISRQGTIVALDKGPAQDEFFLTFERIGDAEHVRVPAALPPPATPQDLPEQPLLGLRHFAEIHASMAAMTTVPVTNTAVSSAFNQLKQQLPAEVAIEGFLASQQMAVTQLAIKYCDQLVETPGLRSAYFPGFDFSRSPAIAFDAQGRDQIINPLMARMLGDDLADQPDSGNTEAELNALMDRLSACGGQCPAGHTQTVVKASCAALLGSAAMLIQ
ncbi:LamG domain-containing protein [Aliiglaciecola sp. CAU 1673]|uniref:LamG domain-containing protein n=1 Tax=Aliiglaciecola sp. CAU 1673 TaxID=3032595 RepID=UPI0023D9912F|nr:LamG domain-containing protein [Aliiglaciecola sp. CAU 1673]MDF2177866.1 LamG domain-containing protein [Aliiglaciecola sp. CAU 1673]